MVRLTVRTNPEKFYLENAAQTGEIWTRPVYVEEWTGRILKAELFKDNDVTSLNNHEISISESFSQTQIQNGDRNGTNNIVFKRFRRRWLLDIHFSPS